MINEDQLIEKSYYETLIQEGNAAHPLQILSEALLAEQKNDVPELSSIRFAQGEVYFNSKDYESAIFKWEMVTNDLAAWAKKNMADAYFELGTYDSAEEIYKSIESDSIILNTEVGLQLFTLYIEAGKIEMADKTIKKAVKLNPDDHNVTEVARSFFEGQRDWGSAVELANNEAVRTGSLTWYGILQSYVTRGVTKNMEPPYFYEALHKLYAIDTAQFEQFAVSLWNSYKDEPAYMQWVRGFNDLLQDMNLESRPAWKDLSDLYQTAYFDLINGKNLLKPLLGVIPGLLRNWLHITDGKHALMASAAVLSWNDNFPSTFSQTDVEEAENLLVHSQNNRNGLEDGVRLFEAIDEWAEQNNLSVSHRYKWIIDEVLDLENHHVLIAGTSGSGKSSFIHSLLGEEIIDQPTSTVMMYKDAEEESISEISNSSIRPIEMNQLEERVTSRALVDGEPRLIDYRMPNTFLKNNQISIMDTPGFSIANNKTQEVNRYLQMVDSLLFVLDVNDPFTTREKDIVMMIKEQVPDLKIHFVLNKMDLVHNDQEAIRIVDEAWSRINPYLPNAKIFAHSSYYRGTRQHEDFAEFIQSNLMNSDLVRERNGKLLYFVRQTISSLLEQRMERETSLSQSIEWHEDLLAKLKGAVNQLDDLEKEKASVIRKSFRLRKEEIRREVVASIPNILRKSKDLVNEDSDFRRVHVELNEKMNQRVQDYLQTDILTKYYHSMQEWIREADVELTESQDYLTEMANGFNAIYKEDKIKLVCDSRVLDDWRRDANRMTSAVQMDTVNILLRFTPQQLLLKSAGRLFGSIANKNLMYNKYVNLIETQDYTEIAETIADKFLLQFDMFEKSINRDIAMFFTEPKAELNGTIAETEEKIADDNALLEKMKSKPEVYRDPLKLFEIKLRSYEWILLADKEYQTMS